MHSIIAKVLNELAIEGHSFSVGSDGETDYVGNCVSEVLIHAYELEEAVIRVIKRGNVVDFVLFIPGLAVDEQIADCKSEGPVQKILDVYFPPE